MSPTRLIVVTLALAITLPASAATLTDEEINSIAATMFAHYETGGVAAMYADEVDCWKTMEQTADDAIAERVGATCMTGALAGAMIERAYAMKQIRGEAGEYRPVALAERANSSMARRFTEEQRAGIKTRPIADDWLSKVIIGLMAAGMP